MKRVISRDIEDLVPWRRDVEAIRNMRKSIVAPVDTMGCHKLADPLAVPKVHRFQVLVALMLSSQTRDEANAAAMKRLKDRGLSIEDILALKTEDLEKVLYPVSFYKTKAVNLQKTASILKKTYDSDIPDSLNGLCSLPGVGPKMAHLVLQIAWQKCEGIAVDTHVHRISNRLGWLKTKTPEQTRVALEKLLPREEWQPINHLLVGFGQMLCKPVNPKCSGCLLRLTCPSSTNNKPKVEETEKVEKTEVSTEIKLEVKKGEDSDSDMKPEMKKAKKVGRTKKTTK